MTRPPRVLVADDSPTAREIYGTFLRSAGFDVIDAGDGQEALDRIRADPPDVLILDVVLPLMDGLEVMRRVRDSAETAGLPIICVTAAMSDEYRSRARELHCAAFLEKPDSARRIVDLVRKVLDDRSG